MSQTTNYNPQFPGNAAPLVTPAQVKRSRSENNHIVPGRGAPFFTCSHRAGDPTAPDNVK